MDRFSGRRVLVTGAAGFIGSHLTEMLVQEGASVRAFHRYTSTGSRGWLENSPHAGEIEFFQGDVADNDSVRKAVQGCDYVFHLAALIGIPYSYYAPSTYVMTNIVGTVNVLQAVREFGIARLLHTSTSETYGTARTVPIDENHPMQGQSPYSASKIGADKMAESYYLSFETPVVTCRPFNTFGPRQSARAIIPTVISQCLAGFEEIKLGSLEPTRDLNYVTNTVEGFLAAAVAPEGKSLGRTFNFGYSEDISIGDLARMIIELTGSSAEIVQDEKRLRPANSEVERLLADNSLAREKLGWEPEVGLREGLERTIEWFRDNTGIYKPAEYAV